MNNLDSINIVNGLRENGVEFIENEPMSLYTSIKIGGKCDIIIFPKDEQELFFIIRLLKENSRNYIIIGRGTNTLFKDARISFPVVSLKKGFRHIKEIDYPAEKKGDSKISLRAGSGVALSQVLNYAVKNCLSGCEFFFGIPGTLGGAVRMNAGSKESVAGNIVESIEIITKEGTKLNIEKKDLQFSYRNLDVNGVGEGYFITGVTLSLNRSDKSKIADNINLFKERKLRQPLGEYSLGCIFKNPAGDSAGKIIEEIGFKGFSNGDAAVSDKHANFIINKGGASAEDILELIKNIQKTALLRKGIKLSTEIKII